MFFMVSTIVDLIFPGMCYHSSCADCRQCRCFLVKPCQASFSFADTMRCTQCQGNLTTRKNNLMMRRYGRNFCKWIWRTVLSALQSWRWRCLIKKCETVVFTLGMFTTVKLLENLPSGTGRRNWAMFGEALLGFSRIPRNRSEEQVNSDAGSGFKGCFGGILNVHVTYIDSYLLQTKFGWGFYSAISLWLLAIFKRRVRAVQRMGWY